MNLRHHTAVRFVTTLVNPFANLLAQQDAAGLQPDGLHSRLLAQTPDGGMVIEVRGRYLPNGPDVVTEVRLNGAGVVVGNTPPQLQPPA